MSGEVQRTSVRISRRASDDLEIEVAAVPLPEKSDCTRGAIIIFRDITRSRRVEKIRRDFVANVSHELPTPLSILRGCRKTLLENPGLPLPEAPGKG